ncbi:dipeptide transport system permease DppB [Klebsiella pneumoniae]|uniref:Dipeptide transport system permease DppB n=1 Tax=Klebsiella pneumoniae TaxID=573 RepID=A0A377V679_KLEPN|nr:dipeptide transport system permease DppB [Klebsiella pneumoniae]
MSTAILAPGSRGRRLSKRLLQVVITLFGLLLLTFTIGRVMPIDPVLAIVGPDADQSTYQQVYQQLGFDKSLTTQFGIYFVNLLHGDLGNALLTGKPVVDDIIRVFRPPWSWQRWRLLSARVLVFRWACWRRRGAIASPIMWYALSAWRATRRRSFGSG